MNTRKDDVLVRLGDAVFRRVGPLDLGVLQQLLNYQHVYNRYLSILAEKPLRLHCKNSIAIRELAEELREAWIYMNIPPMTTNGVVKKLEKVTIRFDKHYRLHESKRGSKWLKENNTIISDLENGFDIKATKQEVIDQCITDYGVVSGTDEASMYEDNCIPDPTTNRCARRRWNGSTDQRWLVLAKKRQAKNERAIQLAENREEVRENDKRTVDSLK